MKTPLITREGYEKLKKEMDTLWREERPEVTKKVTWAASLGDRSENADYQYNKKRNRSVRSCPRSTLKKVTGCSSKRPIPAHTEQEMAGCVIFRLLDINWPSVWPCGR